ncbi:hypothetical protein GTO10_01490 [Candidatus Saccharibacteria bacterium]|nr:hypothetical protein [Candidatus Saccharibacteria bacterium]
MQNLKLLSTIKARFRNKEWVLSSLQYLTGWILVVVFLWGFALPLFEINLPSYPILFPTLMFTFFTHATLGIRSTTVRYKLWRPWLDLLFLMLWIFSMTAFAVVYLRLTTGA